MPLLIVITGYLPTRGVVAIAVIIAITSWAGAARVIRAQTFSLRNREFVEAATARQGSPGWRLMFFEVLPNMLPLVASGFLFSVIGGILSEAGLSFLGLGSLTTTSWGSMLYFAQNSQALLAGAWWWYVPPGPGDRRDRRRAGADQLRDRRVLEPASAHGCGGARAEQGRAEQAPQVRRPDPGRGRAGRCRDPQLRPPP
jgi:hypothetical protein